jgi:hypothetical protein
MEKIVVSFERMQESRVDMEKWLLANAGVGSARYSGEKGNVTHWLNGDDWAFYNQYTVGDAEVVEDQGTVFIFRYESVAVEFALRFL